MNETRAVGTDLERTGGRHSNAAATTRTLRVDCALVLRPALVDRMRPAAAWPSATTCAEAICDLGDRDDRRVTALDWFAVDMANAEAALE